MKGQREHDHHPRQSQDAGLVSQTDDTMPEIRSLFGILAGRELSRMTDEEIKAVICEERSKRYER